MSRLRVLITYPFPLGKRNGGARMTREIARHLGRLGAEVTILPLSGTPVSAFPRAAVPQEFLGTGFDGELARDSVSVVRVDQHPLHWSLDAIAMKRAVGRILQQEKVDLVLSYYHEGAALPALLRERRITFGYISTWQSYAIALTPDAKGLRKKWQEWQNARLIVKPYRQADVLFATSEFTKKELIDVVGVDADRIVLCALGVEPSFLEIPRSKPEKVERLLFFGRLTAGKGVFAALEALGQLAKRGVDSWRFRILGQGDHERVRNAAIEAGIASQVDVCDAVDDAGLRAELEAAHLVVLPSHFEAFGLAFAEAQSAGLPIVAYRAGSVPEVIEDGVTGWLAPLNDVGQLAQLIERAMQDPEMTHAAGMAARKRAAQMFRWENTAATILETITKARS